MSKQLDLIRTRINRGDYDSVAGADIVELLDLYDELKKSFDILLKDHQRVLARFVNLRRAVAPEVDTFQAWQQSQINTMNPMTFSDWCSMWFDAESLEKNMVTMVEAYHGNGDESDPA